MRLLGAKEFLKTVKPGTLCVEFWMSHDRDCLYIIEDFKKGVNLLEKYSGEFYIFGDNGGSMAFLEPYEDDDEETIIDGHKYSCLFYYDKNIVGDALPWSTLQLVFDSEDEWPEKIPIRQTDGKQFLDKEDIKRIIKYFLEEDGPFKDETSDSAWALKKLEEEDYKDDEIINYVGERK